MRSKVRNCFKIIANSPEKEFAIAIVLETQGSVPQPSGAIMLIDADGLCMGSIGGGLLEHQCIKQSQQLLGLNSAEIVEFSMNETYSRDAGPICGGRLKILLSSKVKSHHALFRTMMNARHAGANPRMFIDTAIDSLGDFILHKKKTPQEESLFELIFTPGKKILIAGGGHCGMAIAELAVWLEFEVHLIDPRMDIVQTNDQIKLHHQSFQAFVSSQDIGADTCIVLVNKGHKEDSLALESCIHSNAAYLGMIGSKRKVTLIKDDFIKENRCTEEEWQNIHAPIGLDINAIEVKDIALSIMTEITATLNGIASQKIQPLKI